MEAPSNNMAPLHILPMVQASLSPVGGGEERFPRLPWGLRMVKSVYTDFLPRPVT